MIDSVNFHAIAERNKEKPYGDMFDSNEMIKILRLLEEKMSIAAVQTCDEIKSKLGIQVNNRQLDMLLSLPFLFDVIKRDVEKQEGQTWCVNKTLYLLAKSFYGEGDADNFVREPRYSVMKSKDMKNALSEKEIEQLNMLNRKVDEWRIQNGKASLKCVVVEEDWPEYEPVWKMIEDRTNTPSTP